MLARAGNEAVLDGLRPHIVRAGATDYDLALYCRAAFAESPRVGLAKLAFIIKKVMLGEGVFLGYPTAHTCGAGRPAAAPRSVFPRS